MKIFFLVFFIFFFSSHSALAATIIAANTPLIAVNKPLGVPKNWKVYQISDKQWSIRYPRGWKVIPKDELGTTVLGALRGHDAIEMNTPTIVITEEKLKSMMSSSEFSRVSIQSVSLLRDYVFLEQKMIITQSGEYELHVFTAKSDDSNAPSRRFYQIYTVVGDTGVVFTASTKVTASRLLDTTIRKMLSSIYFSDLNMTKTKIK